MAEIQLKRQMLMEHLKALRKAIIISVIAIAVFFVASFYAIREPLIAFILTPLRQRGVEVITTQVAEALMMQLKACFVAGMVLAMPVITWQIWEFVSPALFHNEKKLFGILFLGGLLMYFTGVAFAYWVMFPFTIDLFVNAAEGVATSLWSVEKYFGFMLGFVVPSGLMFELPVVVYMMARRGWVSYEKLKKSRKYVVLAISFVAMILTPPDVISQCVMGVPMYILFEVGVQISRYVKPKHMLAQEDARV